MDSTPANIDGETFSVFTLTERQTGGESMRTFALRLVVLQCPGICHVRRMTDTLFLVQKMLDSKLFLWYTLMKDCIMSETIPPAVEQEIIDARISADCES